MRVSKKGWLKRILALIAIVIFAVALWSLNKQIERFHFDDFRAYLGKMSWGRLAIAVIATVAGYLALISYDWFALHYIRQKIPLWCVGLTGFVGYAFSMNIGQSVLSGGAVRMRLYTEQGIDAIDVARILAFNVIVGFLGEMLTGGLLFTFVSISIPDSADVPIHSVRWLGILFLAIFAGSLVLMASGKASVRFRNWRIDLPPLSVTTPAAIVAAIDWVLSAVVLYALLPAGANVELLPFLGVVTFARVVSLISMVPGGLGVLESIVVLLMPDSVPKSEALSTLISYRAIYCLIPFVLAIVLMAGHEIAAQRRSLYRVTGKIGDWLSPWIPYILSLLAFLAGVVLLLSGATPGLKDRLEEIEKWVPLAVLELSHFLGSIVGVGLMVLSVALRRRVDAAWYATAILLVAGIAASLFKGLDWEEATALGVVLLLLASSRKRFNRHASLFADQFTLNWWIAVGMVVTTITWIGFVAYERVHYTPELWSRFGIFGDASRFLRASGGIAVVLGVFFIWQLFRPGVRRNQLRSDTEDADKVLTIVRKSRDSSAFLGLLGDKHFLVSESGHSFIMYGIQGRTWVAMGDVIGEQKEAEDLIWEFRDRCYEAGARPAFYQVSAASAHLYAGLGLALCKLGEEARVDLRQFCLDGPARRNLRYTKRRAERDGAAFEIVPAERFGEIADELQAISDEWLKQKKGAEMGFVLGHFDRDYLRHFDIAVIRFESRIVAFANLWAGADRHEFTIDLMRHRTECPDGTMEYLFVRLILWGKEQGFEWFSLGLAPLSGLENRSLAPLWNRICANVFLFGEQFYRFKGLRFYKEKFDPTWEPRYLACRSVSELPVALMDIAGLIGGGVAQAIVEKVTSDWKKAS